MYIILSIILLISLIIFSKRHQRKVDDFNENILANNKAKKDFFDGKNKSKMKVNYKGKLIDMDEHFLDLTNEKN